jgi:hypothetical protein
MYANVVIAKNKHERRWLKCLRAFNVFLVLEETIQFDDVRWFSTAAMRPRPLSEEGFWDKFKLAAFADSLRCAEYIWQKSKVSTENTHSLWLQVFEANEKSKWCEAFRERIHGTPAPFAGGMLFFAGPVHGELAFLQEYGYRM